MKHSIPSAKRPTFGKSKKHNHPKTDPEIWSLIRRRKIARKKANKATKLNRRINRR